MIKIIFFDVDGTLLRMGEKNISDKTLYALKALKKKGILLCMATGRSYPEIPHFDGVDFDILSTFNGSYIVRDEDVIYKNPLNNTDKNMLIQNLKKMNRAIAISNENIIVANGTDPDLEQYFLFGNVELIISDKVDEISKGEIYQVMCSGTCGESVIVNDSVTREAITRKQQRDLLKFIQEDKHFSRYYDAIYILFHTGLRISEFCGLTVSEIEFGEMRIKVDHQLQRTAQMKYVIEEPKTDKGIRYVPMTEAVSACFRRIIANRKTPKVEPMVEGYAGFLFLDKNDMPMVALHWEKYLEHIIQKYNKIYRIQMPKVTPHVCRHTFCSNMAKSGMNPKTLQYIMGHADISVTLNTYTHVNFDDAKEEVYRIANS